MIPGSLEGIDIDWGRIKAVWPRFRALLRRYFWLWIAYQTIKGTLTLCLIWLPIWWAFWE